MKRQTLDNIYHMYVKDVYRYLISLCRDHHAAEDLVQETFYRAYLYLDHCKDEKVKPWLLRVAYNAFIDSHRKERRTTPTGALFFSKLSDTQTPDELVLRKELWDDIGDTISALPDNQKQAILLHDFHDLSYQEAADIMEIRLSHFKILLYRARQSLRQRKERTDHS
ncbi:sigma-70 family RNA polymerase sigma factor [Paenibacillus sp. UNC451MF]|uniref:sigma-70 family RNA polymerase sigma factor n=1 Tax=Paenibacillus sp. UNC451MF TaxID=1449063 RepID=UPI00048E0284|nr:sigma-70 family RNA polymerase sigma factor [Paenibacillus sp. UNC451MF]